MHICPFPVRPACLQLTTATILFSTALSFYVYFGSFRRKVMLAEGGNSGA